MLETQAGLAQPEAPDPRGYHSEPRIDSRGRISRPWAMTEDRFCRLRCVRYGAAAVRAMDRDWKAGRLQFLQRDIGDGSKRPPAPLRQRWIMPTAARTVTRSREHRPVARRRAGASSSTSSADPGDPDGEPEPPPVGRLCSCGCGRDISHKRADARTFDASCRKRVERADAQAAATEAAVDQAAERWERTLPLAAGIEKTERAVADGRLAASTGRRLVALLTRLRLDRLGSRWCECGTAGAFRDPDGDAVCLSCGRWRGKVTYRINGYDLYDALMRDAGRLSASQIALVA